MSCDPLFGLKGDIHERLEVVEAKRGAVAPGTGLILEWARESRREERVVLADVLPDRSVVVGGGEPLCNSQGKQEAETGTGGLERITQRE